MRLPILPLAVAGLALAAIVTALTMLQATDAGLQVGRVSVDGIPVTVFRAAGGAPAPVVVIAHGFAGSQQMMQPFATTLARNGYIALTFDFPGHGRNPRPLAGGLANLPEMRGDLLAAMDTVVRHAVTLDGADGRLAVLGHSMAADIAVRYADAHPAVGATVAISLFFPTPVAFQSRNLLIVDGALEAGMLREQGYAIVGAAAAGRPAPSTTYGRFADGSARRLALAGGVEHIGVLYSNDSMRETLGWLDMAFGRHGIGAIDQRGPWLGLLFLGLAALAWPLVGLLPRVATPVPAATLDWRRLWLVALLPALLTPAALWQAPTAFLPLLLGDYLVAHFAVYGGFTALACWLLRNRLPPVAPLRTQPWKFALASSLVVAYSLLAIGLPLDRWVLAFMPGEWRLPLVGALLLGTLPYFLADEWLTRRLAPMRGTYLATKFCFLLSLVVAVALDLERLFFLLIAVPAILLLFGVYGMFSAQVNERTGHPLVAALANAVVFAWFIAVTFPVVSR
jgi:hypothetical protein